MQYKIVRVNGWGLFYQQAKELEEEVQKLSAEGWQLQGGVSVATEKIGYETKYTLCQAMIKGE